MMPSPSPKHQVPHTYHQVSLSDDEYMDDTVTDFGGVTLEFNTVGDGDNVGGDGARSGNNPGFLSLDTGETSGDLPSIAITPMTPPSGSLSPDGNQTVSLSTPMGSSHNIHNRTFHQDQLGNSNRWMSQSPVPPPPDVDAKDYFAYRDSIVQHVTDEVQQLVDSNDGILKGTWFLTEIDTWDNELERIIVLTDRTILIVKYDFIGMKIEEVRRIHLAIVERLIQGELKYPDKSLTPRLNGLAGGLAGMVKDVIPKVHGTVQNFGCAVLRRNKCVSDPNAMLDESDNARQSASLEGSFEKDEPNISECAGINSPKNSIMSTLSLDKFEARARNTWGIRIVWDKEKPVTLYQKWNPFDKSIPYITLTSHPLLWHKNKHSTVGSFDIETFSQKLIEILGHTGGESPMCNVEYKPIVIETYVGLTSLLYNANSLGFYKVRGKVSF
ncbi:unnamed protein product [Orchesella dallaii]|uniref:HSac2 domain-containing protein n=1 Tax=Orchesella dallaii TaxID=48710 RepID=A0ABP1PRI3_9HEXA